MSFDTYYGDTPTSDLVKNQRQWYHPTLDKVFRDQSAFAGLVPFAFNLGAVNAKTMTITQGLGVHPDFSTLGLRDIWMPASHIDSQQVEVTFNRYGGKVAYHEYDDIITYWDGGNGTLRRILQGELGQHYVDVNDMLIRNAFLSGAYKLYAGTASNFATLDTGDVFDPDIAMDIWLGMAYRNVPMAQNPALPSSNSGSIVAMTTPGVAYSIMNDSGFISTHQYAGTEQLLKYEVGSYKNVRFSQTPRLTLYNCGTLIAQAPLNGAHTAGDGAAFATKVDDVYAVGQETGVQQYIQLDTFGTGAITDIEVGDIISIHSSRTNAFGVTNGADYRDGKKQDRRVMSVDEGNLRIVLDRPIMIDMAAGFVTKARHIHAVLFIGGPNGVVGGVGRAPVVKALDPVDDFGQVMRFSWNGYFGYNVYRPEVFEVMFVAAPIRHKGAKVTQ